MEYSTRRWCTNAPTATLSVPGSTPPPTASHPAQVILDLTNDGICCLLAVILMVTNEFWDYTIIYSTLFGKKR